MAEMKLNRELIEKVIERLETVPESFDQNAAYVRADKRAPCGTVACLAGEVIICSAPTIKEGIKLARMADVDPSALMGLEDDYGLFAFNAVGWPEKYRDQYTAAKGDQKKEARAAINLLRAILRTDGKILES